MVTEVLTSTCPVHGDVVWRGPVASPDAVARCLGEARRAFADWRRTTDAERVAVARAYAAALGRDRARLAEMIARETGKPLWEAGQEVDSMVGKVDISVAARAERAGERRVEAGSGRSVLRHRPHGVMAVLGPYNFPGHLPNGHIVPALLAGNAVVFKPSERTPAVGEAMARAWAEAGLPPGVFGVVQGGRETGRALVEGKIDGLLFTGSSATGAELRRRFADRPDVILALELGGNNPLVVWDGAPGPAAAIVARSAFATSGQRCSCARRLILPDGAFGDAVIAQLAELVEHLSVGAWDEVPEPFMGPLVDAAAADAVRGQVAGLIEGGARVIARTPGVDGRGAAFVAPVVLDVTGIDAPDEEIFGPVLQVVRVATFDAAVTAANGTRFGLAAGLVSADDARWDRFVDEVRAGVINRNRPTTGASGSLPFGGLGASGNHRPSAFYAADYCAHPVASLEADDASDPLAGPALRLRP